MQLASNLGWLEGVELLVEQKARIDEANDAGETPLIAAVHRRDIAMMRVLLKAGPIPTARTIRAARRATMRRSTGRSGPLLAEIEASAKPKEPARRQRRYGPTF